MDRDRNGLAAVWGDAPAASGQNEGSVWIAIAITHVTRQQVLRGLQRANVSAALAGYSDK